MPLLSAYGAMAARDWRPGLINVIGQQEWRTPGTYSLVVPSQVTFMSGVLVGGGGNGHMQGGIGGLKTPSTSSFLKRGATTLVYATGAHGSGGGAMSSSEWNAELQTLGVTTEGAGGVGVGGDANRTGGQGANTSNSGGGGAAGYTANGGDATLVGAPFQTTYGGGGVELYGGTAGGGGGSGAGGGAGGSGGASATSLVGALLGGGAGSLKEPSYGGGGRLGGGGGGGLAYKNLIPVTPGETLTIIVGAGGITSNGTGLWRAGDGGVRLIWGKGRIFPSNAT